MYDIRNADARILECIDNFQLFDYYRLVDIDTYHVFDWQNGTKRDSGKLCYETWRRSASCQNCISGICVREKKHSVKMEYLDNSIFLIAAVPMQLDDKIYSLELISNVTDSLMLSDSFHNQNFKAQDIIANMNEFAIRDPYTNLYNRRYAGQELARRIQGWQKGEHLIVGIMDIDHFKQVNDTYGHMAGDDVLQYVADLIQTASLKADGFACRMGGDEFMILWQGIDFADAESLILKLQGEISRHVFVKDGVSYSVDTSIVPIEYDKALYNTWADFLDTADKRMYVQKKAKL